MAVRRQITLYLFFCCCANIIYTEEVVDRNHESTTLQSEESSNRNELQTGNLSGKITAHKNGAKLEFKINSTVFWKKDNWTQKCIDSKPCTRAKEQKGEVGHKGADVLPGTKGEKGEKGDNGADGLPGITGVMGEKGDKGIDGITGAIGEKGKLGDKGADGLQGIKGEKGEKGNKGADGLPGTTGLMGEKGDRGIEGPIGHPGIIGGKGEKGEKAADGIPGTKGETGRQGDKGTDGLKGEKGEPGIWSDSFDERGTDYEGTIDHPTYSCTSIADNGLYFVNRANKFEVLCEDYKTCIPNLPKSDGSYEIQENKKVWLSSLLSELKELYNLKMSQLSYLAATNEGFSYTLRYNNLVKIFKIMSWNGVTMDIDTHSGPVPLWNGCKGIIQEEASHTDLKIECKLTNYLPMDFYIEATTKNISIQLISLCFI